MTRTLIIFVAVSGLASGYGLGRYDGVRLSKSSDASAIAERTESQSASKNNLELEYDKAKTKTASAASDTRTELGRLRESAKLSAMADTSAACPGADAQRAEWRIIVDQSVERYADMAQEAGRLADKVSALQAYVTDVCLQGAN